MTPTQEAGWTDGFFEFSANVQVFSKTIGLPAVNTLFGAQGEDLFHIKYKRINSSTFIVESITPKDFHLSSQAPEIVNWDLDAYSPTFNVTFAEVDVSQTVTDRIAQTSEYAGNFGIDLGIWKKIGLKFGGSVKIVRNSERIVVTSLGNDDLGGTTVNFADNVIVANVIPSQHIWAVRDYPTGWLSFVMMPVRVQNF